MVDIEYKKSCTEVIEILKYISSEDYEKIPKNIIDVLETDKDSEYHFEYDVNKTLKEQNVSKQARIMIAIFFRDYWATEKQREMILANERFYRNKLEEEKNKKYNPDDIFRNNSNEISKDNVENRDVYLAQYKEGVITKILNKIKEFFKR